MRTHLLQNFVQGLGFDELFHGQARLLFALLRQLQRVWLDETPVKLADLRRELGISRGGTRRYVAPIHDKNKPKQKTKQPTQKPTGKGLKLKLNIKGDKN